MTDRMADRQPNTAIINEKVLERMALDHFITLGNVSLSATYRKIAL